MLSSIAAKFAAHFAVLPPDADPTPGSPGIAVDKSVQWQSGFFKSTGGLSSETECALVAYNGHAGLGTNLCAGPLSRWCSVDTNIGAANVVATQAAETGN